MGRRREAIEAMALLRAVMEVADVAVITFDDRSGRLRLANWAAADLLARPESALVGSLRFPWREKSGEAAAKTELACAAESQDT